MNFYYASLIAFHQSEELPYLKKYLNIILNLIPPLPEDSIFDQRTAQAIIEVKKLNNYNGLPQIFVDESINLSLWGGIYNLLMRIKGGQWTSNEIKKIPLKIFDLLRGNSFPPYTEEMKACDQKLAQIFGGDGAAVTTIYEPKELKNADGTPRRGASETV